MTQPDRSLSEFLFRACHDLRTPARSIRAHAELIQRSSLKLGDIEQSLGFILDGARRIDLLTEGLASYAIALSIDPSSFLPTRMDVVLRIALAELEGEMRDCEAEVTSGELPSVAGNPDRLAEVFQRLLQNSLRHGSQDSQRSPRIDISAQRLQGEWLFAIRDNGPGIDTADQERTFKPFERLNTKGDESAGMGLTICLAIVERHGGRIWVESTPGQGAAFFFTLPVVSP